MANLFRSPSLNQTRLKPVKPKRVTPNESPQTSHPFSDLVLAACPDGHPRYTGISTTSVDVNRRRTGQRSPPQSGADKETRPGKAEPAPLWVVITAALMVPKRCLTFFTTAYTTSR